MRLKSPTGEFDAVLVLESRGGALGSEIYSFCVVKSGKSTKYIDKERVLVGTHIESYGFQWKNANTLKIEYKSGRIIAFHNEVYGLTDKGYYPGIEVVLKKMD